MNRIPVALIGATGTVGQIFIRLLHDHPDLELVALCGSPRSTGMKLCERVELTDPALEREYGDMIIVAPTVEGLAPSGARVVFSAMPASEAGPLEEELAAAGLYVFSNARSHRNTPHVPIVIPEVNMDHLAAVKDQPYSGFIVTNSNCSVSGLAMVLAPIHEAYGLEQVVVTTFQALSGAGLPGVPSLKIMGNVIPFIEGEEEKMAQEARKMLGSYSGGEFHEANIPLQASCARVGVVDGHLESVTFRTSTPTDAADIARVLSEFRGKVNIAGLECPTAPAYPIIVRSGEDRPQPTLDIWAGEPERARGMAVSVGRIREMDGWCRLFLLVHNTIRGAAGDSVLNAEVMLRLGLIQ